MGRTATGVIYGQSMDMDYYPAPALPPSHRRPRPEATEHWRPNEHSLARESFNAIVAHEKVDATDVLIRETCMGRQAEMGPNWRPSALLNRDRDGTTPRQSTLRIRSSGPPYGSCGYEHVMEGLHCRGGQAPKPPSHHVLGGIWKGPEEHFVDAIGHEMWQHSGSRGLTPRGHSKGGVRMNTEEHYYGVSHTPRRTFGSGLSGTGHSLRVGAAMSIASEDGVSIAPSTY
uniref:Uncharacterized protein n=1 Tax=Alexandrium monilatum TaxID=311494 RepID=A0A7S4SRC3_9DINO